MSVVSNLILTFSNSEDEEARMNDVDLFPNNGIPFKLVSADFERGTNWRGKENRVTWYGGSKFFEAPLYMGAINHLQLDAFLDYLSLISWTEIERVQLIIKGEEDEVFKIIHII